MLKKISGLILVFISSGVLLLFLVMLLVPDNSGWKDFTFYVGIVLLGIPLALLFLFGLKLLGVSLKKNPVINEDFTRAVDTTGDVYYVDASRVNFLTKPYLMKVGMVTVLFTGGMILLSYVQNKGKFDPVVYYMIPVVLFSMGIGAVRQLNKQREQLISYRLSITDSSIVREQAEHPPMEIRYTDLSRIIKNKNGSLTIFSRDDAQFVHVPTQLQFFDKVEETLSQIRAIIPAAEDRVANTKAYINIALSFLGIVGFLTVQLSANKQLAIPSGLLATACWVYLTWKIYPLRNAYPQLRKTFWMFYFVIGLTALTTLSRIFT